MILIDTSVWIDHIRSPERRLTDFLHAKLVLTHPLVIEEMACGHLKDRPRIIHLMHSLPSARIATHDEVLGLISNQKLYGVGLGAVDVHLIASAMLTKSRIWTKDKAFAREARRLGFHID
jgi:predicted nucleic acid-binding protein